MDSHRLSLLAFATLLTLTGEDDPMPNVDVYGPSVGHLLGRTPDAGCHSLNQLHARGLVVRRVECVPAVGQRSFYRTTSVGAKFAIATLAELELLYRAAPPGQLSAAASS